MIRKIIPALFAFSLLSACSAEQDTAAQPMSAPADIAATSTPEAAPAPAPAAIPDPEPADQGTTFDTGISVRTLMNAVVKPNADTVWQGVRYVVTEEGVTEDVVPQTDADWATLRTSAITLIEAGNALLLPGRKMDNVAPGPDYPNWQFLPEEMQAMRDADPESWRYFAQEMQFSTKATLEKIEKRDVLGLIDTGARINQSCQGCHAEFWYKPNNQ